MSDRIKGSALTMGGAACWGVSGCMGQYLFTREGMDSTWLVPIRLFLAGLILCGFFFIKDRKTLFDPWNAKKNPRNAIDLLVYGLAGVSCCQFTYFLTIQLSSAGMGTILQDVSPSSSCWSSASSKSAAPACLRSVRSCWRWWAFSSSRPTAA